MTNNANFPIALLSTSSTHSNNTTPNNKVQSTITTRPSTTNNTRSTSKQPSRWMQKILTHVGENWNRASSQEMKASADEVLHVQEHVDLAPWTTFGISAKARWFAKVESLAALREALDWAQTRDLELLFLGGGSNMLLHGDVEALVVHVHLLGVDVLQDDGNCVRVAAGAGEVWHDFVMHTLKNGWGGLENLSLIPGSVGASPMQNIGAYGVEIVDHFAWLDAVRLSDGALQRFDANQCAFGYRESVFRREEKGRWVITRVAFDLDRNSPLQMGYGAIEQELSHIPQERRTHRDVSEAVIRIRQSKLPDPRDIGNAGSFFKNPTVARDQAAELAEVHPDMPQYPQPDGRVRLAAGWLIDQAGWKGHRRGTHGVHDKQALVLVHFGGATGQDIWQLAKDIMTSVKTRFGIQLEPEVNQISIQHKGGTAAAERGTRKPTALARTPPHRRGRTTSAWH